MRISQRATHGTSRERATVERKVRTANALTNGVVQVGRPPKRAVSQKSNKKTIQQRDTAGLGVSSLKGAIRVIVKVFRLYGYTGAVSDDETVEKTARHWQPHVTECGGDWMQVVKYKLAAWGAYWKGSDLLPKCPFSGPDSPHHLLAGGMGAFQRSILVSRSTKLSDKLSFIQSVTQSKKGMPRADEKDLKCATNKYIKGLFVGAVRVHKHDPSRSQKVKEINATHIEMRRLSVTEEPKALESWGQIDAKCTQNYSYERVQSYLSVRTAKEQLKRTVREIFGRLGHRSNHRFEWSDILQPAFPSTSANYINSRAGGGSVGSILVDNIDLLEGLRKPGGLLQIHSTETIRQEVPIAGPHQSHMSREYHEYGLGKHTSHSTAREEEHMIDNDQFVNFDDSELLANYRQFFLRVIERSRDEVPEIEPVALAEALKIRMITKCPPIMQYCLRPLWKKVHTILKQHKTFHLIGNGQQFWPFIVQNTMGRELADHEEYISGDYKAATDNLQWWVSEAIMDEVCECLDVPAVYRELSRRALTQHIYTLKPEKFKDYPEIIKDIKDRFGEMNSGDEVVMFQKTGQLMGSIMSFPILCIANAAMCRWACELGDGRSWALKDCRLAVNGDDCAMRTSKDTYPFWQKITSFCGLEESVGKTFRSRQFVEINSTLYARLSESEMPQGKLYNPDEVVAEGGERQGFEAKVAFEEVKYVNMGLMMGYKKSGAGGKVSATDSDGTTLGALARELYANCPEGLKVEVMKSFIENNLETLKSGKLRNIPWYAPEWIGGVGLPGGVMSMKDQSVARLIIMNYNKGRKFQPMPLNQITALWKVRQLATSVLPEPKPASSKGPWSEYYNRVVGLKCIDLLFDSTQTLETLAPTLKDDQDKLDQSKSLSVRKLFKRNSDLWNPANYSKLPPPLDPRVLEQQHSYASYGDKPGRYIPQRFLSTVERESLLNNTYRGKIVYDLD